MRRRSVCRGIARAALSLLLAMGTDASAAACELRVQMPSIESFTRHRADGELEGYAVDTMREALRRIGCTPRFVDLPGPRSWAALAAGEIDLLFGVRPLRERQQAAWFAGPIDHVRMALYVRRAALPASPLQTLGDVRGTPLRIGIERLSSYGPEYDALLDDPDFLERLRIVVSREASLAMLANGRLDAVFADAPSARRFASGDVVRAVELTAVPVHVGLSRVTVTPERFSAFNAALASMAEDGTLARMRAEAAIESAAAPEAAAPEAAAPEAEGP